jgi:hypothetical protein
MNTHSRLQRKKSSDAEREGVRMFAEPRFGAEFAPVQIQRATPAPAIQPKLTISQPGDPYEQEADRVADQVMRMPDPTIQRSPAEGEPEEDQQIALPTEDEENLIQRAADPAAPEDDLEQLAVPAEDDEELDVQRYADPAQTPEIAPRTEASIAVLRGGGQPLDETTRAFMEPRFGHDFSQVRVHTGVQAAESARSVSALAYTVGQDVVFGAGQYAPGTDAGRRLMAHELTHVVQQGGIAADERLESDHHQQSMKTPAANAVHHQPHLSASGETSLSRLAVLQSTVLPTVMRAALFTSTLEIRHRVLKSRVFPVSQGGLIVTANAAWEESSERYGTESTSHGYAGLDMTLSKEGFIFDSEYGTCEFETGRPSSRIWTNLPDGDYYLTIFTDNSNPNHFLRGVLEVAQQSGLTGDSCTRPPPGALEVVHTALDLAGLIPALGVIPDTANTGIYLIEGDWENAGLSAIAIIPVFGDAASVVHIGEKTAVRVSSEAAERLGRDRIARGFREARAADTTSSARRATAARPRTPDDEYNDFLRMLDEETENAGFHAMGEPVSMQPHSGARRARQIVGVGSNHESAHNLAQSVGRGVPGYNPSAALTTLQERAVHRGMDQYWKEAFQRMRQEGRSTASAQEIYDTLSDSIRHSSLPVESQNTLIRRLQDEMFVEFGMRPGEQYPLPYPNITRTESIAPLQRQIAQPQPDQSSMTGVLQRTCACGNHAHDGECDECKLRREASGTEQVMEVPAIVDVALRSNGQPLNRETRSFMEPRFGHDFSQVRVHTDAQAAESARSVSALAYTVGQDMVFGAGQYAPGTDAGRRLMAHELTHVVQQGSQSSLPHLSCNQRHLSAILQRKEGDRDSDSGITPHSSFLRNQSTIKDWQKLVNLKPARQALAVLARRREDDFLFSGRYTSWKIQTINEGHGLINLDYYPVHVSSLPSINNSRFSANRFLNYFRKNINLFVDPDKSVFEPYDRNAASKWYSTQIVGSIIHIDLGPQKKGGIPISGYDDGSVIVSDVSSSSWTFSTIQTPGDMQHPVSGNREFGFDAQPDGTYIFYTRGADRVTGWMDLLIQQTTGSIFDNGDILWRGMQQRLADFINSNGGSATVVDPTVIRQDWDVVKQTLFVPDNTSDNREITQSPAGGGGRSGGGGAGGSW